MAAQARVVHVEDEESYFMSMTDVVIGLLFVFIIMLMFFAMRFQEATKDQQEATWKQNEVTQAQNELIDDLTDAEKARNGILREIGTILQGIGLKFLSSRMRVFYALVRRFCLRRGAGNSTQRRGSAAKHLRCSRMRLTTCCHAIRLAPVHARIVVREQKLGSRQFSSRVTRIRTHTAAHRQASNGVEER